MKRNRRHTPGTKAYYRVRDSETGKDMYLAHSHSAPQFWFLSQYPDNGAAPPSFDTIFDAYDQAVVTAARERGWKGRWEACP
jgi:hypothetical protein